MNRYDEKENENAHHGRHAGSDGNEDMIAIDQDTLGIQGLHYCDRDGLQFWFKPLAGGDWAFTILNPTRQDISCCLNWQDFNPLPPFFREDTYLAREVYLLRNISSIG